MITYADLADIRKRHTQEKIVFCTGSFDIAHAGHILFLEDCKEFGDILVVGVGNDSSIKVKGQHRPILNEHIRVKTVSSFKPVDYAFIHKNSPSDSPFYNTFMEEIFKELKPDVWIVNTDASEIPFRQLLAEKYGIEFVVLNRECPPEFEKISTSQIIEKIQRL